MTGKFTRRTMLKLGVAAGGTAAVTCSMGYLIGSETGLLDRLQGISKTSLLANPDAWAYDGAVLTVDLSAAPELAEIGGAVRLEDEALPVRVLIVHGVDDTFYAYKNECTHGQRRIDVKEGTALLKCCSISGAEYDYDGAVLSGPAPDPLTRYAVTHDADTLAIALA